MDYEPTQEAVNRLDMETGWACFVASGAPPKPEDLPLYLSKAVAAWQKQNPMLTVRLPIVASGNTIALYVWFDRSARLRPRRFTALDNSPPALPAVISSPCRKLDTPFKHASTGMSIFDVQLLRTGPIAHFVKTEHFR